MTRIKICGFTQQKDAEIAIELGADALGFVFYAKSKRSVIDKDVTWIKRLPPFVQIVGLFVNPEKSFVDAISESLPLDILQFHGNESSQFCEQFRQRYIKAVPMQDATAEQAAQYMQQHPMATSFLLDNYGVTEIGGSGTTFDWSHIPLETTAPLTLAGGLTVNNVGDVVKHISPYAVDVSSGVESAPGIKSADKMAEFIDAVRSQ